MKSFYVQNKQNKSKNSRTQFLKGAVRIVKYKLVLGLLNMVGVATKVRMQHE